MGSEWKKCLLGDVIELKRGYDLPKNKRVKGPYAIISSSGTSDFHSEYKVKAPGVVTGRYGTIGEVFYTEQDFWPLNTTLYVRDFKGHDPLYIYYFLKTIPYHLFSDKAAVPGVNRNHLHMAEVEIPGSVDDEKEISRVLASIDSKIQLNHQTNQTLEKMAQALFKSWFVDFDPVIDNALEAGKPIPPELEARAKQRAEVLAQAQTEAGKLSQENVNSGEGDNKPLACLSPEIRKLFPSEFEETEELGWVPKGWSIKDMTDLVDTVSETYPLKSVDKVIFLNTGDIEAGQFLHENYSSVDGLPGQAKKSIRQDDILYSEIRPKNKRYAYVNFEAGEHVVSTKLMVLRSKGAVSSKFAYFVLSRTEVLNELQRIAELRSGTFPQITYKELSLVNVVIPDDQEILKLFSSLILDVYYKQQFHLQEQNVELEKLRDTLLPKLISGELRLPSIADIEPSSEATTT